MVNYGTEPWIAVAPVLGIIGAGLAIALLRAGGRPALAFCCSGMAIAGVVATAGLSLFPFMLPSSLDPNSGLTLWDASSSLTTLIIMAVATAIFLPIVIGYTAWVYAVLRGPVTDEQIAHDPHTAY